MSDARVSPFQIGRMMMSLWVPQAVHAAAELGLADALAGAPMHADELARKLATHPDATARLLAALAVIGLVEHREAGYSLTELGQFLRSDVIGSRRAWARLIECVRTGAPSYASGEQRRSETETFDHLFADPGAAEVFHRAMADGTRGVAADIVAALALDHVERIVDVGGGFGELLCAALERQPKATGVVFDLAHASAGARRSFEQRGLVERAAFVVGDLFVESPPRADLLLLKSVIHDWSDDRALTLLERCRAAMGEHDRLVVVEPPAPPPDASLSSDFAWIVAFSDLNMLVNTGGRERTVDEFTVLFGRAGLRVLETRPTGFYSCFVCAAISG